MSDITLKAGNKQRLGWYTLAAGAMVATGAQAAPTPSPNLPVSVTADSENSYNTVQIDIDGNGVDDFELQVQFGEFCDAGNNGGARISSLVQGNQVSSVDGQNGDYAGLVASGSPIPGSLPFPPGSQWTLMACYTEENGGGEPGLAPLALGDTGLFAVQFMRDGALHNGFLKISVEDGSVIGTALEGCYESEPRAALSAGRCYVPPIPVNGAIVPLSLAMLAIGAAALRRRKRQA